ncbi:hypothetical protein Q8A73_016208 [Channa argus]|nr:hypothetical protein Q8A73_016208 [Channa argus]
MAKVQCSNHNFRELATDEDIIHHPADALPEHLEINMEAFQVVPVFEKPHYHKHIEPLGQAGYRDPTTSLTPWLQWLIKFRGSLVSLSATMSLRVGSKSGEKRLHHKSNDGAARPMNTLHHHIHIAWVEAQQQQRQVGCGTMMPTAESHPHMLRRITLGAKPLRLSKQQRKQSLLCTNKGTKRSRGSTRVALVFFFSSSPSPPSSLGLTYLSPSALQSAPTSDSSLSEERHLVVQNKPSSTPGHGQHSQSQRTELHITVNYSPALGFNSIPPLPSGNEEGGGRAHIQREGERRMRCGEYIPLLS